ncbi:MAG: NAD(P)-binding domain-containing protein [Candidatus Bathyarchaeota archaeon]|nr:NAD(P)-binding domain-containing protein [Candidatus Bathyarchaeota archaeon]
MRPKVCVIGLGVVGYPTAEHISKHGFLSVAMTSAP